MSQYSEIMGSFISTGDYPIEANYIFSSEEELKAFYTDELNNITLHKGLLKIVSSEDSQTLYWVVEVGGELQFKPLIQEGSIDKLFDRLAQIRNELNQEISDRNNSILEIVGTDNMSEFHNQLDNLLAISNAVVNLQEQAAKHSNILSAIVGTEEENILEYLKSLDYNNLSDISNLLHKFFDTVDDSDSQINTLPELQKFLRNLQTELDQTQVGVGLSEDGSFSPDQETNYLKSTTSIMDALKTLDGLIAKALKTSKLVPIETNTVSITVGEDVNNSNISANAKVSNGSDIIVNNDGLYTKLSTEYENGILTIKVNGSIRSQHNLAISSIIDNAYYDQDTKSLVFNFKNSQEVIIPLDNLIGEWVVDNPDDKVVELSREKVVSGTDKLSADVRLGSQNYNILKKVGNSLSVDGRSSSITHDGQHLSEVLKDIAEWSEG